MLILAKRSTERINHKLMKMSGDIGEGRNQVWRKL